jgi:hypothetical protein
MTAQIDEARTRQGPGRLEALLLEGETWVVE